MKKISRFLKKNRKVLLFSTFAFGISALALFISLSSEVHKSELTFIESSHQALLGKVMPASCDTLRSTAARDPGHTVQCTCDDIGRSGYTNWPACDQTDADLGVGINTTPASGTLTINGASSTTIPAGDTAVITWNMTGPIIECKANWGAGNTVINVSPSGSATSPAAVDGVKKTYGITCYTGHSGKKDRASSYSVSLTGTAGGGGGGGGGGGCFIAGTQVLMADGTYKNIENVTLDDAIMTSGGGEEVMKIYRIAYKGSLYAFNGNDNYFVTPTHPFMTQDGWKSLDPEGTRKESKGIIVSKLEVGDTLLMKDGKTVKLTSLDSIYGETMVYNFGVNGTHDFYADNYLVHNVDMGVLFEKAYAAVKQ